MNTNIQTRELFFLIDPVPDSVVDDRVHRHCDAVLGENLHNIVSLPGHESSPHLLWWDSQCDGPQVDSLVGLDARQDEEDACNIPPTECEGVTPQYLAPWLPLAGAALS